MSGAIRPEVRIKILLYSKTFQEYTLTPIKHLLSLYLKLVSDLILSNVLTKVLGKKDHTNGETLLHC